MNEQTRIIVESIRQELVNLETAKMEQTERHHNEMLEAFGNITNRIETAINELTYTIAHK